MAVSLRSLRKSATFCRFALLRQAVLSKSCSNTVSNPTSNTAASNNTEDGNREPKVGMSADGRTLICWHPEPLYPYEHSQPLRYNSAEVKEGDVVPLQKRLIRQYETRWRKDGPTKEELSRITFTTKHRWFPNNKKKYQRVPEQIEREGL